MSATPRVMACAIRRKGKDEGRFSELDRISEAGGDEQVECSP